MGEFEFQALNSQLPRDGPLLPGQGAYFISSVVDLNRGDDPFRPFLKRHLVHLENELDHFLEVALDIRSHGGQFIGDMALL